MIATEALPLQGAKLIVTSVFKDRRGAFEIFWDRGLVDETMRDFSPSNALHSYNAKAGTLRGIHYQRQPHGQAKLISCIRGRLLDVIVDLRKDSPTFGKWHATELAALSGRSTLIPKGCGHGFLTLEDNTTIAYLIEGEYRPEARCALRWNDDRVAIDWPVNDPILSESDAGAPGWEACEF